MDAGLLLCVRESPKEWANFSAPHLSSRESKVASLFERVVQFDMVHELVYISRSVGFWVTAPALDEMLSHARAKNERLGITGVLLYHEGEFVQLLEGGKEEVTKLFYNQIARDPRHRRTMVCWEFRKPKRSFKDWQMGFVRASDLADPPAGFLGKDISRLDLSGPNSTGRELLLSTYEVMVS